MNAFFEHAFEFVFSLFLLNCAINFLFGIDVVSTVLQFIQMKIAEWKTPKKDDKD